MVYGTVSKYRKPLAQLILISLLTKIVVAFATAGVFRSFVDLWGYNVYLQTVVFPFLQNGSIPYISYNWEYPTLMLVPTGLATIAMIVAQNIQMFYVAYAFLMAVCDAVTIACVYFITLKIRGGNKNTAFMAGLLVATAFSAAYHIITCFDAFAVMLMMLGLYFTICNDDSVKSYFFIICGYLAKLFPAAILPFVFLYNRKKTDANTELNLVLKVLMPLLLVLVVPFVLINPESIWVYFDKTEVDKGVFGSTLNYATGFFLQKVLGVSVDPAIITIVMYCILAVVIGVLVWSSYHNITQKPVELLKYCLLALTTLIIFVPHHSPQYMIWIVPILAILAANDWWKILWFYLLQVVLYIKFPLTYYSNWTNAGYNQTNWGLTLTFFIIQFAVLGYLIWITTKKPNWRNT